MRLVSVHGYTDSPRLTQYFPEDSAQIGFEYTLGQIDVFIDSGPDEIQTPTHWNPIGHSMTAPPPVLSPSSILTLPWSLCAFMPARKNSARFKFFFKFFACLKFRKY
jgi:hypothetical protein